MDLSNVLDFVRSAIGGVLAVLGLCFIFGGELGKLRFPDFYSRVHAAALSDVLGAALVAWALAVLANDAVLSVRCALLGLLIFASGPVMKHLVASTAYSAGLSPVTGAYTAPRPGGTA